mmetsp:Transcript_65882/g.182122  ORF Transcript_65882/g.182122 Transcript_65882/m.182122 type:complete len:257 (+) Transcript_65882:245-1015(+)
MLLNRVQPRLLFRLVWRLHDQLFITGLDRQTVLLVARVLQSGLFRRTDHRIRAHRELALLVAWTLPPILAIHDFVGVQVEVSETPARDGVVVHFGALLEVALLGRKGSAQVTRRVHATRLGGCLLAAEPTARARGRHARAAATLQRGRHTHEPATWPARREADNVGAIRFAAVERLFEGADPRREVVFPLHLQQEGRLGAHLLEDVGACLLLSHRHTERQGAAEHLLLGDLLYILHVDYLVRYAGLVLGEEERGAL